MRRCALTLLCIFLSASPLQGQGLVDVVAPPPPSQESVKDLPNPWTLHPDWWQVFDVESDSYDARVNELEQELRGVIRTAAEPQLAQELERLLSRILLNLRALPEGVRQKAALDRVLPEPQETYRVADVLEVLRTVDAKRSEKEQVSEDLLRQQAEFEEAQDRYDALLSRYLATEKGVTQRLELGFQLIAQRAAIAVAEQQQRLTGAQLSSLERELEHFQKEVEVAEGRLVVDPQELAQLGIRIRAAEQNLQSAQRRLLILEERSLELFPNTAEERAEAAHMAQQVVEARIQVADRRLQLSALQVQEGLNLFLSTTPEFRLGDWLTRLRDAKDELEELEALVLSSVESTEKEYERASKAKRASEGSSATLERLQDLRLRTAQATLTELQALQVRLDEQEWILGVFQGKLLSETSQLSQVSFHLSELLVWMGEVAWGSMGISLFKVGGVPVTPFGLLRVVFIVVCALWLSRFSRIAIQRVASRQSHLEAATFYSLGRLAHYTILTIGLVVALVSLGIDFSNLALVAGALSVGIGFGLQSIVSNFLSGLIILFEGNLRVGDFLELESGMKGRVTAINVRSTVLRTNDGIEILIPNAEFVGGRVVNWTMSDVFRRVHVPFGVAYGTDTQKMMDAVIEAAGTVEHTLKGHPGYREPRIFMTGFGDSSLNFELVVWVNRNAAKREKATMSAYYLVIHQALLDNGIEIPFPQRDLHIKDGQMVTPG